MYSQNELDEAVAAGAITAEAATSLRAHIERQHSSPMVDEEQFRLLTGFNDIFVSIAAAILLFSVAWIGHQIGTTFASRRHRRPSPLVPRSAANRLWPGAVLPPAAHGGRRSGCCWLPRWVFARRLPGACRRPRPVHDNDSSPASWRGSGGAAAARLAHGGAPGAVTIAAGALQ